MDGWDQQQQTPPPPPQTQPQTLRVSSPPPVAPGVMMPQHAYDAMPSGSVNPVDMPLAFNPMASPGASSPTMKPADMPLAIVSVSGSGGELVKKKRGRPRNYGPDGTLGSAVKAEAGGQSGGAGSNSNPDGKRRGRPPGSGKKKQLNALGSAGTSFTPHIIIVKTNEDVASKIMSFSQQGPRTTCIISANGALCTATLRQPATTGGIVTYEVQTPEASNDDASYHPLRTYHIDLHIAGHFGWCLKPLLLQIRKLLMHGMLYDYEQDPKEVKRQRDRERYAQNRDEINKRRREAYKQKKIAAAEISGANAQLTVSQDRSDIKNRIERECYAQNREEILKRQRQALMATGQSAVTQLANITCAGGAVPNSRDLLDENENIYGGDESDWLHRNDAYQIQRKSGQVRVTQMEVVENPQLNLRIQEDSLKKRECDGDRNQIETTDVNHDEEARIFAERV
ncbi:hypothetical protein ZWY2020_004867 [Hordeum vulgare]|nr:hypothetical protein ZWY2020_004867 [Hordeum vulgare]